MVYVAKSIQELKDAKKDAKKGLKSWLVSFGSVRITL